MKTLKSLTLALALIITCNLAKANDGPSAAHRTRAHAINSYLNIVAHGKIDCFDDAVDKCAKFSLLRGKEIMSCDKQEMGEFLKGQKNIVQVCTTTTQVVESNVDMTVFKVDMKFTDFTRSNYVTVANTPNGWKITNVYSVFK